MIYLTLINARGGRPVPVGRIKLHTELGCGVYSTLDVDTKSNVNVRGRANTYIQRWGDMEILFSL